jgi:nuclear cap-binding protein subunit 1
MECARLLVEYPRWTVSGTFKPHPGDLAETSDHIPLPWRDWQLESTLIEVLFPFFLHLCYVNWHLGKPDNSRLTVPLA